MFSSLPSSTFLTSRYPNFPSNFRLNPLVLTSSATACLPYNMVKRLKRSSSFVASDNSGGEEPPAKVSKVSQKAKKDSSSSGSKNVDDEGNTFWDVSTHRLASVSRITSRGRRLQIHHRQAGG